MLNHPYSVFNAILFGLAIFLEYIKARIRFGTSTYYYDGVRIYMQIPWLVRTLFPRMTYKALISNFAYGAVQRLQATLFRIWRVYEFSSSSTFIDWIRTTIPKPPNCSASRILLGFLLLTATVYEYPQSVFAAIYKSDNTVNDPRVTDFDHGFDVLFDNGANVTIGIDKSDFIDLEERKGSISGVGAATAEGIGTIHWRTILDDGSELDIIVPNALYVPSMDLRILSIDQLGRYRTTTRTDGNKDCTFISTQPDYDRSILFINRNTQSMTIPHTNGLAKCRCSYPNDRENISRFGQSDEFGTYNAFYANWQKAYSMNIPSKTPALRLQDAPDPSTVPVNDLSKLKAQKWTKEWKSQPSQEKSTTKKVRFPVVLKEYPSSKYAPPNSRVSKPLQVGLRPSKYTVLPKAPRKDPDPTPAIELRPAPMGLILQ